MIYHTPGYHANHHTVEAFFVYVHLGNNPINLFNLHDHLFKKNYDEKTRPPPLLICKH